MGKKRVFAVGVRIAGAGIEQISNASDRSLLDADIVFFSPSLGETQAFESYNGKPLLTEADSTAVPTRLSHWHSELRTALAAGKLIVVFLVKPEEVFVYTGKQEFSGTGRNQKVTSVVSNVTSYAAVPYLGSVTPKSGTEIRVNAKVAFFAPFWAEFKSYFTGYEVWVEGNFSNILLQTRVGDRVVGAAVRQGVGAILYVPPVVNSRALAHRSGQIKAGARALTKAQFGTKLVAALVSLAESLAAEGAVTPPPTWARDVLYQLPEESDLRLKILETQQCVEQLKVEERRLEEALDRAGTLRRLLYEQGKPLEEAILEALRLMGFTANIFKDGESEFDAVFTSAEGRFLGEAEGKDNRAINIEKFSQLERNLHEDFEKEGQTDYAKGVLFGNAYRLFAPAERGESFTDKCVIAAKRTGIALVRTPDLFEPARYLKTHDNAEYARRCRESIYATRGDVVRFPALPRVDAPATGTVQ